MRCVTLLGVTWLHITLRHVTLLSVADAIALQLPCVLMQLGVVMAFVSIKKAAELTGKSVDTLYRKIKRGDVSAKVGADGEKVVDTAELMRVFGELQTHTNATQLHNANAFSDVQLQLLQAKLDAALAQVAAKDAVIHAKDALIQTLEGRVSDLRLMLPAPQQVAVAAVPPKQEEPPASVPEATPSPVITEIMGKWKAKEADAKKSSKGDKGSKSGKRK